VVEVSPLLGRNLCKLLSSNRRLEESSTDHPSSNTVPPVVPETYGNNAIFPRPELVCLISKPSTVFTSSTIWHNISSKIGP